MRTKKKDQVEDSNNTQIKLNVEKYMPDGLIGLYSDAVNVLHSDNEFIVSFYQTEYPAFNSPEDLKSMSLRSKCLVQIILSPSQMEKTIMALQENFQKYQRSVGVED